MSELPSGTVTLFFADIEGSTSLLRQLGHDRYGRLLSDYRSVLRQTVENRGGREIDMEGDACFFAFRRASDGVLAAAEAQRALGEHDWPGGGALSVRMGLHTGEPSVADIGYLGLAVHRAARICSAGRGAQVLLSHTTRALIQDEPVADLRLRDLGPQRLKDFDDVESLYQLLIEGQRYDAPPLKELESQPVKATPFAGQEDALAAAVQAAVGKSRLERLLERWRFLLAKQLVRIRGSLPLHRQAIWESARRPRNLAVLVATLVAALALRIDLRMAAVALVVVYVLLLASELRVVRASHDLEAIGWRVHATARIAPTDDLRTLVASLGAAISRTARSAKDVERLLAGVSRKTLVHRLQSHRERSTVSTRDLEAADATARQIASLDELAAAHDALDAERAAVEIAIRGISNRVFQARLDPTAHEALTAEVRSILDVVRVLGANLEAAYESGKMNGLSENVGRPRLKVARSG